MVLSFELLPAEDGGTRLAAETRVTPTDAGAGRAFGRYWTAIRLGGGLIRLELLRGIRRRAEAGAPAQGHPMGQRAATHGEDVQVADA
jgi:hypothetical protein